MKCKFISNTYKCKNLFDVCSNSITRGHKLKIKKPFCTTQVSKHFLLNRVVYLCRYAKIVALAGSHFSSVGCDWYFRIGKTPTLKNDLSLAYGGVFWVENAINRF